MKRKVIVEKILLHILMRHSCLSSKSDDYRDIEDDISDEKWEDAITRLSSLQATSKLHPLLNLIKIKVARDVAIMEEELNYGGHKREIFVPHRDIKYRRSFAYFSQDLIVADISMFYASAIDESLWQIIEHVCFDSKLLKKLINGIVCRSNPETYYIEYKKNFNGVGKIDEQELYSYALAKYLRDGNKIEISTDLDISPSWPPSLASSFRYNAAVIYREFYDIYDAINDWYHATDIIVAFTKMYQIVEYMIYRKQMSEIVARSNIKQSFLRETKNLNKKYSESERGTIISNIPILFPGLTLDSTDIANAHDFLNTYFDKSAGGNVYLSVGLPPADMDKAIARFIYDVRCSIVHNKESEFHILYSNVDTYKPIVPLMKQINEQMGEKFLALINTPSCVIHYKEDHMDLY